MSEYDEMREFLDAQLENPDFLAKWEAFEDQRVRDGKVSCRSQVMRRVWAESTIMAAMHILIRLRYSGEVSTGEFNSVAQLSMTQLKAIAALLDQVDQGELTDQELAEQYSLPALLVEKIREMAAEAKEGSQCATT